jgi:predicted hotdog family 3-hydroxylacyl-ACP dehydratase
MSMSMYKLIETADGLRAPSDLAERLVVWHDAMVTHERVRRAGAPSLPCDEECPHWEARELWAEAVAVLGDSAHDLTFLRSRALGEVHS